MKARLNIPNKLSEITLRKYQKFVKLNVEDADERFLQIKMIEIFCEISHEKVLKIKFSDADRVTAILGDMFLQKPKLVTKFKLNGVEYGFIPELDEISFGEYIDLDTYLGDWENIHTAMNVLYRPIESEKGERYVIKDYNVDTKDNLLDMPLDAVISSVFFFLSFRERLVNSYESLFNEGVKESTTSLSSGFNLKWGWYQAIFTLAKGDIRRFENITQLKAHECFMMLEYMKEKNELESSQIKQKYKR